MPDKKKEKDFYCGLTPQKKGQRKGNMKECAEAGQVRLYGLYKVDPKILQNVKDAKKKKKDGEDTLPKLTEKRGFLMGSFNRLKKDLTKQGLTEAEIKKMREKMAEIKKEFETVQAKINKLEATK